MRLPCIGEGCVFTFNGHKSIIKLIVAKKIRLSLLGEIGVRVMTEFKKYRCEVCTHIYDEAKGDPDSNIEPGTLWEDIPEDWVCPECGATKKAFRLVC